MPEVEYKQREEERIQKRALLLDTLVTKSGREGADGTLPPSASVSIDDIPPGPAIQLAFKYSLQASGPWSTSVLADQPLAKVIPDLRAGLGLASDTALGLFFDGAPLDTSQSPQQLQLEHDDLIDVRAVKR